jgi:hypothetical protein
MLPFRLAGHLLLFINEGPSMETFDSQGKIMPIGASDQGIVSKKIKDKDGQGQGPRYQPQRKVASSQPPENDDAKTDKENHVIDIVV